MRWIMNTEAGPAVAVPADVPFKLLPNKTHSERKMCLKRSLNSEPASHITGVKRKCSTLREFSEMCLPAKWSLANTIKHPKFSNELPDGGSTSSTCMEELHDPHQSQSLEVRRKEKYALQIQRTMIADEDGDRPIHISVVQEDINLVQRLCRLMKTIGVSLDIFNNLRQTPLHLAVIIGNPNIIRILLQHGASINIKDRYGSNAIHLAVKFFQEECFQILLGDPSSRSALDSLDYEGLSAIHHAVINGNMSTVNFLYYCGADVNNIDPSRFPDQRQEERRGSTLHRGWYSRTKTKLKKQDGKNGRTALMQAILQENIEMAHLLLKCGALAAKADYSGLSALDVAHQMNNKRILQLLEKEIATKQDSEKEVDASGIFRTHMTCSIPKILQPSQNKSKKQLSTTVKHCTSATKEDQFVATWFQDQSKRNCPL